LPSPPTDDRLAERRYVTVVLRVLVDMSGQLVHAEVVAPSGAEPRRVGHWRELTRMIRASVDEQRAGGYR
jgi:hypothetical protein